MTHEDYLNTKFPDTRSRKEIDLWLENNRKHIAQCIIATIETESKRSEMTITNDNEYIRECQKHGKYHGEFSHIENGIGQIEKCESLCPICSAECKIISIISYNVYIPIKWDDEEY